MEPLIGITTYAVNHRGQLPVPRTYVDAVRRAGGAPVLLPAGCDAASLVPRLDGLVLTGGGDLDPAFFDQPTHESVYGTDAERDGSDLALVHAAVAVQLPMLAICRGMQVVNVALGGTLHQHLPDVVGDDVAHRADPPGAVLHDVEVDASSLLADVMGQRRVRTMSWHHQAIDAPGKGLSVVATAPDGIVEGLALDGHPACLIVQWHPELTASDDPMQQALFDHVVAATRDRIEA